MPGRWQKLVTLLNEVITSFIKKYGTAFALKALGIAGGFWTFLVGSILVIFWKIVGRKAEIEAVDQDHKETDEANIEKYKEHKAQGAPVETLIKDETDLLNRKSN